MNITVNGESFSASVEGLTRIMEAKGFQAIRDNQNPHPYFQWAEHLKKKETR